MSESPNPMITSSPSLRFSWLVLLAGSIFLMGCGSHQSAEPSDAAAEESDNLDEPPIPVAPALPNAGEMTVAELRAQLRAKNPGFTGEADILKAGGEIRRVSLFRSGVTDISPLEGLPLRELDLGGVPVHDIGLLKGMPLNTLILEETNVDDISVLKGMPLKILHLQHTAISDIGVLQGMELRELNLFGTQVRDISVVRDMPLDTLWLQATPVSDISPLEGKYLVSLDIQDTPVRDLSVVGTMISLKRLNIAGSQATDLTPLAGLQLDRLIFTPDRIETGLEVARNMSSLKEIGLRFENMMPPAQFWARYDAGEFQSSDSTPIPSQP